MKKTIVLILIIVVVIISIIFTNYVEYSKAKMKVLEFNKEFLEYKNSNVQINTIITLMNKAIQKNKDNQIEQDENQYFKENDKNSIRIFVEIKSKSAVIPMEKLILDEKSGMEKVSYAFSDMLFKTTKVEYHERTGQVKKIVFTAIEEE